MDIALAMHRTETLMHELAETHLTSLEKQVVMAKQATTGEAAAETAVAEITMLRMNIVEPDVKARPSPSALVLPFQVLQELHCVLQTNRLPGFPGNHHLTTTQALGISRITAFDARGWWTKRKHRLFIDLPCRICHHCLVSRSEPRTCYRDGAMRD